jgi:YVTN family beta-propeller protein
MRSASVILLTFLCFAQNKRPPLAGMPPVLNPNDIYSEAGAGKLSPVVKNHLYYVYVPNAGSNTVDVIDQNTFKIVNHFAVGREPQHVVPSWDLKHLYATNDHSDTLNEIDPTTGKMIRSIPVADPYNMYFTPDGKFALVVAERLKRLDFRDPQTFKLIESINVPCRGVDHLDFSADGTFLLASCEFSGEILKVDVVNRKVVGTLKVPRGGMPQDMKVSPDGKVFYSADMEADGLHLIDGEAFKIIGFLPTGRGAHGLYTSRDSKVMYVSNRGEGTVSVVDLATRTVAKKWTIPGGGSPDMGGLSADGKRFWLSGRYHHEAYVLDTETGKLITKIKVGNNPHGLCVWPAPGRYSIGHTGILR